MGQVGTPSGNVTPFLPLMLMARSSRSDAEIDLGVLVGQSFDEELRAWQLFPMVCLLRSGSEGRVRLTSAEPGGNSRHPPFPPRRRGGHGRHVRRRRAGDGPHEERTPRGFRSSGCRWGSDAVQPGGAPSFAATGAGTMFHPSGSCRMTPAADPLGVVDHLGRVHGIGNLRVADASIFPGIPRATIHFPVVAAARSLPMRSRMPLSRHRSRSEASSPRRDAPTTIGD